MARVDTVLQVDELVAAGSCDLETAEKEEAKMIHTSEQKAKRRARSAGMLAYRQELRSTIPEAQLALLEANMPKSFLQSCVDNEVPLKDAEEDDFITYEGLEEHLIQLESKRASVDWSKTQDAPECFRPNALTREQIQSCITTVMQLWSEDEEEEVDIF